MPIDSDAHIYGRTLVTFTLPFPTTKVNSKRTAGLTKNP